MQQNPLGIEELFVHIMFDACDGVLPSTGTAWQPSSLADHGAHAHAIVGRRGLPALARFLRGHYRTIQRMRRVARWTGQWLLSEDALGRWLRAHLLGMLPQKSYIVDRDIDTVWRVRGRLHASVSSDPADRALVRFVLAQQPESVVALTQSGLGDGSVTPAEYADLCAVGVPEATLLPFCPRPPQATPAPPPLMQRDRLAMAQTLVAVARERAATRGTECGNMPIVWLHHVKIGGYNRHRVFFLDDTVLQHVNTIMGAFEWVHTPSRQWTSGYSFADDLYYLPACVDMPREAIHALVQRYDLVRIEALKRKAKLRRSLGL